MSLDKYQEELSRVLPAAFLDSLDPAYLNNLKQMLQARDVSVHFLSKEREDLATKVSHLTSMLQRAHEALKDICRSPELLGALPEEVRSKVYAIGDDLLIQEYAEELAGSGRARTGSEVQEDGQAEEGAGPSCSVVGAPTPRRRVPECEVTK